MLIELKQLIPVTTPVGRGYAILVECEVHDQWWTVVLDDNCAVVTFKQEKIRVRRSDTHGRGISDEEMIQIIRPRGTEE